MIHQLFERKQNVLSETKGVEILQVYRVGLIGVYFFDSFYSTNVSTAVGNQLDSTEKK